MLASENLKAILHYPAANAGLGEPQIMQVLGDRPAHLVAAVPTARTGSPRFVNDFLANPHGSFQLCFRPPFVGTQFRIGSGVYPVTLIVPTSSLVDGLEALNRTGESGPHGFLRLEIVRVNDLQG